MKKLLYTLQFCILIFVFTFTKLYSQVNENYEKALPFSDKENKLILSGDNKLPMRVLLTTNVADSLILRTPSNDYDLRTDDPDLDYFIKRLYATVTDTANSGVGIAAPQVGILKKIILVQRFDKSGEPIEAYINPKILKYTDKKQDCREGCLSIPDRRDTTKTRSYAIMLAYDLPDKTHHIEMVEGFTAVIFQHEIDHINGILYIDRLKEEKE
jgi:peptide deformylase